MEAQKLTSNAASGHSAPPPGFALRDLNHARRVAAYPEFESAVAGPYARLKSAPPIRSATLGALWSATAFPANDGRDFLNDLIRLKFRCHFFWDGCD